MFKLISALCRSGRKGPVGALAMLLVAACGAGRPAPASVAAPGRVDAPTTPAAVEPAEEAGEVGEEAEPAPRLRGKPGVATAWRVRAPAKGPVDLVGGPGVALHVFEFEKNDEFLWVSREAGEAIGADSVRRGAVRGCYEGPMHEFKKGEGTLTVGFLRPAEIEGACEDAEAFDLTSFGPDDVFVHDAVADVVVYARAEGAATRSDAQKLFEAVFMK
jgi:hypothetical protein